jgi:hypothetical protein
MTRPSGSSKSAADRLEGVRKDARVELFDAESKIHGEALNRGGGLTDEERAKLEEIERAKGLIDDAPSAGDIRDVVRKAIGEKTLDEILDELGQDLLDEGFTGDPADDVDLLGGTMTGDDDTTVVSGSGSGDGSDDGGMPPEAPEDRGGDGGDVMADSDGDVVASRRPLGRLVSRGRLSLSDAARHRLGGGFDQEGHTTIQPGPVTDSGPSDVAGGLHAPRSRGELSRPGSDPRFTDPPDDDL